MVYVDDMRAPFGRMIMCHMIADSRKELLAMCRKIGVGIHWLQKKGQWDEHFDIALSKRKLAVEAGAKEVTQRGLVMILRDRRQRGTELEDSTKKHRVGREVIGP